MRTSLRRDSVHEVMDLDGPTNPRGHGSRQLVVVVVVVVVLLLLLLLLKLLLNAINPEIKS